MQLQQLQRQAEAMEKKRATADADADADSAAIEAAAAAEEAATAETDATKAANAAAAADAAKKEEAEADAATAAEKTEAAAELAAEKDKMEAERFFDSNSDENLFDSDEEQEYYSWVDAVDVVNAAAAELAACVHHRYDLVKSLEAAEKRSDTLRVEWAADQLETTEAEVTRAKEKLRMEQEKLRGQKKSYVRKRL